MKKTFNVIFGAIAIACFLVLFRQGTKVAYLKGRTEAAREYHQEFDATLDSLCNEYSKAKDSYFEMCEVIATYEVYKEAKQHK